MLKTFLKLNIHKLKFAYFFIAITFSVMAILMFMILYFKNQLPNLSLILYVLLGSFIGFPVFLLLIAFLEWVTKKHIRSKTFSNPPFNQLEYIGFYNSFFNEETIWYFTEEIKSGRINNFIIECNIEKGKKGLVYFKIIADSNNIPINNYSLITNRLKDKEINPDLSKAYKIAEWKSRTINQLKSDLERFTEIVRKEGFKPY
jgi:hypothetical protein